MKCCPRCGTVPHYHYSSNVTARQNREVENRNHWTRYFMWSGNRPHADDFGKTLGVVPEGDQAAISDRWDAHAEQLFTAYTATWSEVQRTAFRARIWPKPPPPVELFNRYHDEEPTL